MFKISSQWFGGFVVDSGSFADGWGFGVWVESEEVAG
jgi:hypothetical protein